MKQPRKIGFVWLFLAGFFLWNPVVGVTDVLPDLLGYLLLCVGISKLADLNDDLAIAQRAFRSMLWVSAAQIAAHLLANVFLNRYTESINQYEQPVWVLLFAFVFLVLEWYLMLPAWKRFFKGLSDLAEFHGGTAVLKEANGRTLCERMASASRWFVILRSLLTLLPELTVLTSFEVDAANPMFTFDWYPFASLFRIVAAVATAVIGLIWLIRYLRFLHMAEKDEMWQRTLEDLYETEILPNTGLLLNRRVGSAFSFFRVGIFFTINLSLLYYEFLPDWFCVILFLCGWLMLGSLLDAARPCLLCGGLLFGVGVTRTVLNVQYLKVYIPKDAFHLPNAYEQYQPIRWLGHAEAVLTLLFAVFLIRALLRMAEQHTSVDYGADSAYLSEEATERLHRALNRKAIPVLVCLSLSAVCKIAEQEVQASVGWFWMVQFVCSFAAAILFSSFLSELAEKISDRYPIHPRV